MVSGMSKAPWEHISAWHSSQEQLLELLREAVAVRASVTVALPEDNAASRGYVFYQRWVTRLEVLAGSNPNWRVVHGRRGVFALDDVPLRLYRAPEDARTPPRVLHVCSAEYQQLTILDLLGVEACDDDEEIEADVRLRVRVVTDRPGKTIHSFVFEELDEEGALSWSWSIAAANIPERLTTPVVTQPPPSVLPRVSKPAASARDDE